MRIVSGTKSFHMMYRVVKVPCHSRVIYIGFLVNEPRD
jgi:hypothetical protein